MGRDYSNARTPGPGCCHECGRAGGRPGRFRYTEGGLPSGGKKYPGGFSEDNVDKTPLNNLLPDFCSAPRLLRVLVLCEAVAVVLALTGSQGIENLFLRLLLLSIYLQWIGVCSAAALCLVGRYSAGRLGPRATLVVSYIALLAVTLVITEITYTAGRYTWFAPLLGDIELAEFVLRSLGICAVVSALALRYFWLRASWKAGVEAEARVRFEALQARIRPHFLFNSLNSIASLIAVRPDDAERATEDLATLLRARLRSDAPEEVRMAEELALVEAYLRIEQHRLGGRLQLDWDISPEVEGVSIPTLCLQPLVENAISHGIAARPDGGTLLISARMNGGQLWVRIVNPVADGGGGDSRKRSGNRQALLNIEQRLALRYGHQARLLTMQKADCFYVDLLIPAEGTG